MLPFLTKPKTPTLGTRKLESITSAVHGFLASRGVVNFKVHTLEHEGNPLVLIKAEPQKKLRFSNIIEIQIREFLREHFSVEVPGVFWRFKVDSSAKPGPEQADYDFEEIPTYTQDKGAPPPTSEPMEGITQAAAPLESPTTQFENESYDARASTEKGMEVEEIHLDFSEFLKGSHEHLKHDGEHGNKK
jgi:hypothetical protein